MQTLRLQRMQRTSRFPDRVGPDDGAAFGQRSQLKCEWRNEPSRQTVPQPTTTPATTPIESPVTTKTAKGSSSLSLIDFSAGGRESNIGAGPLADVQPGISRCEGQSWGIPRSPLGVFPDPGAPAGVSADGSRC